VLWFSSLRAPSVVQVGRGSLVLDGVGGGCWMRRICPDFCPDALAPFSSETKLR
jgi:hypothetical protein